MLKKFINKPIFIKVILTRLVLCIPIITVFATQKTSSSSNSSLLESMYSLNFGLMLVDVLMLFSSVAIIPLIIIYFVVRQKKNKLQEGLKTIDKIILFIAYYLLIEISFALFIISIMSNFPL